MTLATRQTLAAFHRSSMVAWRCLRQSRSASNATSSPILLRNLKQSTTVLAGAYTRTTAPATECSTVAASKGCRLTLPAGSRLTIQVIEVDRFAGRTTGRIGNEHAGLTGVPPQPSPVPGRLARSRWTQRRSLGRGIAVRGRSGLRSSAAKPLLPARLAAPGIQGAEHGSAELAHQASGGVERAVLNQDVGHDRPGAAQLAQDHDPPLFRCHSVAPRQGAGGRVEAVVRLPQTGPCHNTTWRCTAGRGPGPGGRRLRPSGLATGRWPPR